MLRGVLQRSVLLNLLGQLATILIGFVPSILVARWLGPTDRGLLAVIGTTSGIAFVLACVGIPAAVLYYGSDKSPPTGALLGNSLLYAAALTAAFVVPTWIFRQQIADLLSHGRGETVWVLSALTIPVTFLDWTTHNQLLGRLRFGYYNTLIIGSKVVFLACVVLLLKVVDLGVAGVVIATLLGSVLVIGGALRVILPEARPSLDRGLFRRMWDYGKKSQFGSLFQYFNSRFDVLILQFFVPLAAIGSYVVAQILAELVMVLTRSFQPTVTSLVTRDADDPATQAQTTSMSMRHHGLLCFVAVLLNAVFSPLLIVFAYGPGYRSAILPFFIILPGVWFLATGLLIANDLNGRNKPGLASKLSGVGVGVTIILDFALIPPFGVAGAAVASLLAYTGFGVLSLLVESQIAEIPARRLLPTIDDLRLYPVAVRRLLGRLGTRPSAGIP
jgi:O-antigen/teichoic acid export membrane protein